MTNPPPAPEPITACLLHADYHVMSPECWGVTLDWMLGHEDVPEPERRNAYQAAVERRALDVTRQILATAAGLDVVARTPGGEQ